MTLKKTLGWACFAVLAAVLVASASAQPAGGPERGKAEMKAGTGSITLDYGRPSLKGRDMLSQLQEGAFWRMGMNQATVLTTPVDLMFGSTSGFRTAIERFTDDGVTVVVLANRDDLDLRELALEIAKPYLGRGGEGDERRRIPRDSADRSPSG